MINPDFDIQIKIRFNKSWESIKLELGAAGIDPNYVAQLRNMMWKTFLAGADFGLVKATESLDKW